MSFDHLFCHLCQSILDLPNNDAYMTCSVCGTKIDCSRFENIKIVTTSRKDPFENLHVNRDQSQRNAATIKEKCPKCGNSEMEFTTVQLRSVDEGQTVFYSCPKCSYKYSLNN